MTNAYPERNTHPTPFRSDNLVWNRLESNPQAKKLRTDCPLRIASFGLEPESLKISVAYSTYLPTYLPTERFHCVLNRKLNCKL